MQLLRDFSKKFNRAACTILCVCGLFFINACSKKSDPTPEEDTTNFYKDGEVRVLIDNGPNSVNLVVLGDGFIQSDLSKGGVYDQKVQELVDFLFGFEPYKRYKDHFSVHIVYTQSKRRGAVIGQGATDGSTRFNTYFHEQSQRVLMIGNPQLVDTYIRKAVPMDKAHLKVLIVNDERYGGAGGEVAVVSTHEQADRIAIHEIAHTFANLGDEYVDEAIAYLYPMSSISNLPNVDTTNDPAKVKWKHFLGHPDYQPEVGIYEGAYYRSAGVFRPESQSIMGSLSILRFNAPSREAIVQRIHEIIGTPYNFDEFVIADKPNIGAFTPPQWSPIQVSMPVQVWYNGTKQ